MDYEKKYKEALELARDYYKANLKLHKADENAILEDIFHELAESEDEEIKKDVKRAISVALDYSYFDKETANNCLAWLEKQGEKPQGKTYIFEGKSVLEAINKEKVEPKFKVGDMVNKNDREDEEHCILTITSVNIDEHCYICNQCSVIDFGEQDLWHIVEQKPAWREEDEIGLIDALWAIKQARTIAKDENDMGNLWYAEDWLKSLKDRYTWKPSDEQMKALRFVKKAKILDPEERESLNSLYMHLKKLK